MVVYVDVLLAANLYLTFLLLLGTEKLSGNRYTRTRRLAASVVGAASSLTLLLPDLPGVIWLPIRAVFAVLIVWTASGEKRLRPLLMQTVLFFAAGLVLAGGVLLLSLWNPGFFAASGGVVYLNLDVWTLLAATTLAYCALWMTERLRSRRASAETLRVTLEIGEKRTSLNAVLDTGNTLTEPFSGIPVAVVRFGAVERTLPQPLAETVPALLAGVPPENLPRIPGLRLIPARTVRDTSLLPAGGPYEVTADGRRPVRLYLAFCRDSALPNVDILLPARWQNSLE